ncbi:hypothetical protein MASR2M78_08190 [Treponema sp.]
MAAAIELVGIGNALVDVFSSVDEDLGLLFKLESSRPVHLSYEKLSEILAALPEPVLSSGGGTANVVKLASGLGLSTAFIGSVGSNPAGKADRFAQFFEKELQNAGVSTHLSRSSEPTGACAILRFGEDQNYIAASPSAALSLKAQDLDEGLIKDARVLVLDGFLLEREDLVNRALSLADEAGTAIALDVSSVRISTDELAARIESRQEYPIILFLNEAEADAFCHAASIQTG